MTQPRSTFDTIERAGSAGERATLEAFLDEYRAIVLSKLDGVSDQDARRALVPSGTNLGGILKHLRWVETGWFHRLAGGETGTHERDHERATEFRLRETDTVASVISDYRTACATSREVVAGRELDDHVQHRDFGSLSLRWIYVHLIEETARHAGHMDILREQLDGSTG